MKQGKASRGAEFEAAPVKVFAGDLGDLRQPRQAQGKPKASPNGTNPFQGVPWPSVGVFALGLWVCATGRS